jgi:alpha-L-fucosidase
MHPPTVHGPTPSPAQLAWHRRGAFGFVHFTVNTFTDREWGYGDESESVFAPAELDCHQWVAAAKAGGLSALILTAKHHDGFCLWPTTTTPHNVSRSPFRDGQGDVVRELAEACRAGGIGFGLYCSPWDRNHPDYGRPEYVDVYHAQWRELLTQYGPLCEVWFDLANGGDGYYGGARERRTIDPKTYYRWDELWAMVRQYQPGAVMFSDVGPDVRWCGNESGYTGIACWAKVSSEDLAPGEVGKQRLIEGDPNGAIWRPAEAPVSIRPGWFWHPTERARSGENLFKIWLTSVGRGAGLNLNIPPDRRGLISAMDVLELKRFRSLVETFTAVDLALGRATGEFAPLTDGSRKTYWAAGDQTAEIVIELGQNEDLGGVWLEEAIAFGQQVEAFAVDARKWGGWFEVARGATIGAQRILDLTPVNADAVRIRILASQAPPVLSRVMVYAA